MTAKTAKAVVGKGMLRWAFPKLFNAPSDGQGFMRGANCT
jgi:hypothetical protein